MRTSGWIFMLLSVGSVIVLTAWCFVKVLTMPKPENHVHSPVDIDTRDLNT